MNTMEKMVPGVGNEGVETVELESRRSRNEVVFA